MTAEIIADYKQGIPLRQIAKKYYVSPCYVYSHLEGYRRGKNIKADKAEVVSVYLQGFSIVKTAEKLGISKSWCKVILKSAGVRLRHGRGRK